MMRCVCVLLIACLLSMGVYAQENGDGAYQQGDYTTAIRQYEAQIANGNTDIALWVNLGNAYWMNGENAQALRHLLRAQQALPRDTHIATTIALIRAQTNTLPTSIKDTNFWRTLGTLTNPFMTFQELSVIVWGLWVFVMMMTSLVWVWRSQPDSVRWLWGLSVLIFGLSMSLLASRYFIATSQPSAVVMREATAYSGADSTYLPLFTANSATEVRVLSEKNNWVQVVLSNDQLGWLPLDDIALVNPN